jgi:hypothetical protein
MKLRRTICRGGNDSLFTTEKTFWRYGCASGRGWLPPEDGTVYCTGDDLGPKAEVH